MNSTVRKGEECFFILKKYGGIVVSYTKKVEGNRIQKTTFLLPMYKDNGELYNSDINNIQIQYSNFIISSGTSNFSSYIKVLGENSNISFSKLKIANEDEIKTLRDLVKRYEVDIKRMIPEYDRILKEIKVASAGGDIYKFNDLVGKIRDMGFRFNNDYYESLKYKCYSGNSKF